MANGADYKLVDDNGVTVPVGSIIKDARGTPVMVSGFSPPRHEGSTGRVDLRDKHGNVYLGQFFPSVVNLRIVKR
jgi:hypothetical protein